MTASNRASKIDALHKSLKKHFKPAPDAPERSVLEHLLYACCLEDARFEQADEAFAKLQQTYFDWNEVRVTTVSELAQCLQSLPLANQAALRIKQCLQSLFEARYQYEIDDLKKANLGKAVAELEAWKGMSPFVVSYVSQQALGGHSIPIGHAIVESLLQCEIVSPAEAEKKSVPGLERAIPKNKGSEFASLLIHFAMEMQTHPKSASVQAVLKDLGVTYKTKAKVEPKHEPKPSQAASKVTTDGSKGAVTTKGKGPDKPEHAPPPQASKKAETKKSSVDVAKAEKPAQKPAEGKDVSPKGAAKPVATKKMTPPSTTKQAPGAKAQSAPKKKETSKKSPPKKPGKKDNNTKQSAKSKPVDSRNKKTEDGKTTKRSMPPKGSAGTGSVSSTLTKKKPK